MKTHLTALVVAVISLVSAVVHVSTAAPVFRDDERTLIIDRTGYEWDITRAVELGFKPEKFQYGIGRNAFDTLDDADLDGSNDSLGERARVIGVELEGSAHAYSVDRLRYHEIANTTIAGRPIAAGY